MPSEESAEFDFEQILDMEDKKILTKRKKRTIRVEDCNLDIDELI